MRNAIPTETDFADLIAASLNQADDGVLKLPDQPLGLVRQKPDQPVLRFFADPAAEGSVWQVQLGAGDKPGFGLAAADGKLALFVDGATGNVGIGTDGSAAKLHIVDTNQDPNSGALILGSIDASNLRLGYDQAYTWIQSHGTRPLAINPIGNRVGIGTASPGNKLTIEGVSCQKGDPQSGIEKGGLLALKGDAPQIDFIDTEHGDWAIHVSRDKMYFIRQPWEYTDLVLDGVGRVGIGTDAPQAKLNIREITGTPASANKGTLLLDHEDDGGASSIVFRSKVNRGGGDHAFIEFRDKNPLINDGEAALLTIGMQNDINDHIALMPSGNVGIGTTTPGCKLDVNGDASIGGSLRIGAGCEIFFPKYGQIRSLDDAHRILFRIDDSKMELREYGDIVFSSGSTQGQETSKMVIHGSGNVGIGTTTPGFKLDVNGTVRLGGFTSEEKNEWPNIVWCRDLDKGWDEGLMKHGKSDGFFGRAGFGIHIHESRSFELFSTNWRPLLGIEGGSGNTSIRGSLNVNGKVDSQNVRIQATATDHIMIDKDNWTDMPQMKVTADIDGPVLVLFKTGGVQGCPGKSVRARFRLLIDKTEKAFTLHEFHNEGWELRDASLMWLESLTPMKSLTPNNHEFKVQWKAEAGTVNACHYNDLRSLIVVKL